MIYRIEIIFQNLAIQKVVLECESYRIEAGVLVAVVGSRESRYFPLVGINNFTVKG
jgi:hypothetical protein